jgi:hypothetical protein
MANLLLAYQRWFLHFSCCLLTVVAALDSHVLLRVALETFSNRTPNLSQWQECDDDDYMMSGSSVRISTPQKISFFFAAPPIGGKGRQHLGFATSFSLPVPFATCEYEHCNGIGTPLRC